MLKKALYAFAAPKHRASKARRETPPHPRTARPRVHRVIQRYPTKRLPKAGGLNATLVVLIPLTP